MNFSRNHKSDTDVKIELTSLIDVMFLLLIFFLITTTFVTNQGIQVQLPRASAGAISEQPVNFTITVDQYGQLFFENEKYTQESLADKLKNAFKENIDLIVIIQADEEAQHGIIVGLLDMAKNIGIERLAIATAAEE